MKTPAKAPAVLDAIQRDALRIDFPLSSEPLTGALLRTLAASKRGGNILEIGTGIGAATCWLIDGMDEESTLTTIEIDAEISAIAQKHLAYDPRVTFVIRDAETFLDKTSASFDLIFADTFVGKFRHLDQALALLNVGGIYVIDDLLHQPSWRETNHQADVDRLIANLEARPNLHTVKLDWASGIMICTRFTA